MKIRKSIFETNSSSCHSISLSPDMNLIPQPHLTLNDKNQIVLDDTTTQFGWEIEDYTDPMSKLSYLIIDNYEHPEKMALIREAVKEYTGYEIDPAVEQKIESADCCEIYIDHESCGITNEVIYGTDLDLIKNNIVNFVFNPNSVLHTDNDNH